MRRNKILINIISAMTVITITYMANVNASASEKKTSKINACNASTPVIKTKYGDLCGIKQTTDGRTSNAYLGIPYARPPIADLRWRPPQKIDSWKPKTFAATQTGSPCTQPGSSGIVGGENCLYLNVWTPTETTLKNLPVLVDIHGGGFLVGTGNAPVLNGAYTASKGKVIVVTLNYRLGSLGFLRYQENNSDIAGNFAILDQHAALQWVHDNIAAFGGDPKQVTIAGESAGAFSVGLHLLSVPKSNNLFRAAIMESNVPSIVCADAAHAAAEGSKFIDMLCKLDGKKLAECPRNDKWLNSLPIKMIMKAQSMTVPVGGMPGLLLTGITKGVMWGPIVDIDPVAGQPINGFAKGNQPKPFVIGFNQNEGVFFMPDSGKFTNDNYKKLLVENFGKDNANKILNFERKGAKPYNPASYKKNKPANMTPAAQAMAMVMTHYGLASASLRTVHKVLSQMKEAKLPLFVYYFTQKSTFDYSGIRRCTPASNFICHTAELPYVFHNFVQNADLPNTTILPLGKLGKTEIQTSDLMNGNWVGFTKNPMSWKDGFGHPSLKSLKDGPYVNFDKGASTITDVADIVNYDFWLSINIWP